MSLNIKMLPHSVNECEFYCKNHKQSCVEWFYIDGKSYRRKPVTYDDGCGGCGLKENIDFTEVFHHFGCDHEYCPICDEQLMFCEHVDLVRFEKTCCEKFHRAFETDDITHDETTDIYNVEDFDHEIILADIEFCPFCGARLFKGEDLNLND